MIESGYYFYIRTGLYVKFVCCDKRAHRTGHTYGYICLPDLSLRQFFVDLEFYPITPLIEIDGSLLILRDAGHNFKNMDFLDNPDIDKFLILSHGTSNLGLNTWLGKPEPIVHNLHLEFVETPKSKWDRLKVLEFDKSKVVRIKQENIKRFKVLELNGVSEKNERFKYLERD